MKPISVCFYSPSAYHLFNPNKESMFGGAEVQLYQFSVELAKDNRFSAIFIVGDFDQPVHEFKDGVELFKLPKATNKFIGARYLMLWSLLDRVAADVIIQRAFSFDTAIISLYCRLKNKKFIYMAANDQDISNKKPDWIPEGLKNYLRWKLFQIGLKNSTLVVTQNSYQQYNLMKNHGIAGFIRPSAHFISENNVSYPKKSLLWIGRCESSKQPNLLIDLARLFPCGEFIMICPRSNDIEYFTRIKNLGCLLPNLRFIDFVPFNKIDAYYLGASLLIDTSKTEGFPNTFIQALKNKTPILSLNINPNGMLEKYNIGRCANGDLGKLKKDLIEIMGNEELWNKLSENGYQYVLENHDIKKVIEGDKKMIFDLVKVGR